MITESERVARIIESQVVGDGGVSDRWFAAMATEVRKTSLGREDLRNWVGAMGHLRGIDTATLKVITDAISGAGRTRELH
jgi:hypothetical protein